MAGSWGGKGAEMLGLSGAIERDDFHRLCENRTPEGEKLTPRDGVINKQTGETERRVFYDFTFDLPKSASIIYTYTGDKRILEAMERAVAKTMDRMEAEMHTRVRKDKANHDIKTGNMVYGSFLHFTTRPVNSVPDPHVHMHVPVFNATYSEEDQCFKAGQFGPIKKKAYFYQELYHSALAQEFKELGFELAKTDKYFEIAGVTRATIERYSRRTELIERIAKERDLTPAQKAAVGALIRENKNKDFTMSELWDIWYGSDRELWPEIEGLENALVGNVPRQLTSTVEEAVNHALEKVFFKHSTVEIERVYAEALKHGITSVTEKEVVEALHSRDDIIVSRLNGETMITTRKVLAQERAIVGYIRKGKNAKAALVDDEYVFQTDIFNDPRYDTREQEKATRLVMESNAWIVGVRGFTGSGKTTLMGEVDAGLGTIGKELAVFAPLALLTNRRLKVDFEQAQTVEMLLRSDRVQKSLKDKVLWVDEAGMLGVEDMLKIFQIAAENGAAKVVLGGDTQQTRGVKRGDALRIAEEFGGLDTATLTQIFRQKNDQYREAVKAINEGRVSDAVAILKKMGAIVDEKTIKSKDEKERESRFSDPVKESELAKDDSEKEKVRTEPEHKTESDPEEVEQDKRQEDKREVEVLKPALEEEADRCEYSNYEPGMIIEVEEDIQSWEKGASAEVVQVDESRGKVVVVRKDQENPEYEYFPVESAAKHISVHERESIQVATGDRLHSTKLGQSKQGTMIGYDDPIKIAGFTKEGDIITNEHGIIPKDYGHLRQPEAQSDQEKRDVALTEYLSDQYVNYTKGTGKSAMIVSPTHVEGEQYTSAIRGKLKDAGRIQDAREFDTLKPTHMDPADRAQYYKYEPGMVIRVEQAFDDWEKGEAAEVLGYDGSRGTVMVVREGHENPKLENFPIHTAADRISVHERMAIEIGAGDRLQSTRNGTSKNGVDIYNGDSINVVGFTKDGDLVTKEHGVIPKDYGHLRHGYYTTPESSQGMEADKVFASFRETSLGATDLTKFLVAVSRGKDDVMIVTDDVVGLEERASEINTRMSATEMVGEALREKALEIGVDLAKNSLMGEQGHQLAVQMQVQQQQDLVRELMRQL